MAAAVKLPSRRELVERMGGQPVEWAGQCHQASTAVVEAMEQIGQQAVVRRGYFVGKTTPGAYFHGRPCQHSWVELPDGRVLDPTRFAFVGGEPWPLWIGPADEYDIGGMRSQGASPPPPSAYDDDASIELRVSSVDYFAGLLGVPPEYRPEEDDDGDMEDGWILITHAQAHWLAHLSVVDREAAGMLNRFFAPEAYAALEQAGLKVLIPIDRWDFVMGARPVMPRDRLTPGLLRSALKGAGS